MLILTIPMDWNAVFSTVRRYGITWRDTTSTTRDSISLILMMTHIVKLEGSNFKLPLVALSIYITISIIVGPRDVNLPHELRIAVPLGCLVSQCSSRRLVDHSDHPFDVGLVAGSL